MHGMMGTWWACMRTTHGHVPLSVLPRVSTKVWEPVWTEAWALAGLSSSDTLTRTLRSEPSHWLCTQATSSPLWGPLRQLWSGHAGRSFQFLTLWLVKRDKIKTHIDGQDEVPVPIEAFHTLLPVFGRVLIGALVTRQAKNKMMLRFLSGYWSVNSSLGTPHWQWGRI